jgi:hypothetical protein
VSASADQLMFMVSGQIHRPSEDMIHTIATVGLRPVVQAWLANIERLLLPHTALDCLAHSVALHQRAKYRTCMEIAGRPFLGSDDAQSSACSARARAEWLTFRPQPFPGEDTAPASLLDHDDLRDILESLSRYPFAPTGLQRMLENQVTNAWTAFELLGGDLWEAALNAHPHQLSDLKGRSRRNVAQPTPSNVAAATVHLTMLQRYDFDLRARMGSLLKSRFSFTVLDGIREAYAKAFDEGPITAVLDDTCLEALAILRNVLEHKAGQADEEYVRRAGNISGLPAAVLGGRLQLNGEVVRSVVQSSIWKARDLIVNVDSWIVAHSPPPAASG